MPARYTTLRRFTRLALLSLAAGTLIGCGGSGPHPVKGTVVFDDGRPAAELAGYTITFDCPETHKSATGQIKPDGTFYLRTFHSKDGAFPGQYKVILTPPHPRVDERRQQPAPQPFPIDNRYLLSEQTDLVATVEPTTRAIQLQVRRSTISRQPLPR
jgi:hypothetical protein